MRPSAVSRTVVLAVAALVLTGCTAQEGPPQRTGSATVAVSDRGPGLKRMNLAELPLPVPRTFDLTHVTPAAFAQALGKDVTRIFEFVRDNIAFEAYSGVLRGPRGTLLALAGNSADRAALLAGLLTESGYRVRYARGTLSETDARELITSMWAPLTSTPAAVSGEAETFVRVGKRDVARIRDAFKGSALGSQAAVSIETLLQETLPHYWVQVEKDGAWTDLDPTFAAAVPGRTYARLEETLPSLPASLFHRVTIRMSAEESDGTQVRTEELVTYDANAAELSGVGVLVVHVPENWQGPVRNIQGALSAGLSDTGRIKPVLLIGGRQPIVGSAFPVEVKTTGAGSIGNLLSGQGTRHAAELATAERIEFRFEAPDGRSDTVSREIFDRVGPARRARNAPLTEDEIRTLATGGRPDALLTTVLNVFITTGRLDASHLAGLPAESAASAQEARGTAALLRRLAAAFSMTSDTLFEQATARDGTVVRFYPDSPRVFIDELSAPMQRVRLAIDLRRDNVRIVAAGSNAQVTFAARILRGAVEGTLERTLLDYAAARLSRTADIRLRVSTSQLFEQADAQRVSTILLTTPDASLDAQIPADALARVRDEIRLGNVAVALQHPIDIAGTPRYAWWRINPQTGETVAVMDDGLYATSTEYVLVAEQEEGKFDAVLVTQAAVTEIAAGLSEAAMQAFIRQLVAGGFRSIIIAAF